MKKILYFLLIAFVFTNTVYAGEVKDEMYYKRQIQNQRYLYSNAGLVQAIQQGKEDIVELYMLAGFEPNISYVGIPLIFYAISAKQPECLDVLLKAGANPYVTSYGETTLTYAIKRENSDMVKSLIQYKIDVNNNYKGQNPLRLSVAKKQTKIAELLLKAGAKPDEKTLKMVKNSKDEYLKDLFSLYIK